MAETAEKTGSLRSDQNQHWNKVNLSNGAFRLEKRNTNFSIDGNRGAENFQDIYLWISDDGNVNQQWNFMELNAVPTDPKPNATVTTLAELRSAIMLSNQNIVMQSGHYNLTSLPSGTRNLLFSGSNNIIDLVDVYIEVPVGSTNNRESYVTIDGSGNKIIGGTFEDTYNNGLKEVVDFVAYNNDRAYLASGLRGEAVMSIYGESNLKAPITQLQMLRFKCDLFVMVSTCKKTPIIRLLVTPLLKAECVKLIKCFQKELGACLI